jgi:serine/threonine protein kinase
MSEAPQVQFRGSERFELIKLLGRGATGVVYEALDREQGVRLALKVLAQSSPRAISLFKNEFRALQGIRHRNLVELRELLFDQGHWLLTMELVAGAEIVAYARGAEALASAESALFERASPTDQTLRSERAGVTVTAAESRQGGAVSEPRVRMAFTQLAEGLNALHAANMIHRDLKPSNVLVDAQGRVVILDFGLVTDVGDMGSVEHRYLLGTPRYMAPEQAALKAVTRASDWYSVGVMLHEALTGSTPLAGSSASLQEQTRSFFSRVMSTEVSTEIKDLCVDLLAHSPWERPSGDRVLSRISAVGARRAPTQPSLATASDSIFVGRESELAELHAALGRVRDGEPCAVLVDAESGVGKTALALHFLDQVRAQEPTALCFLARCYERESLPYKALDGVMDCVWEHLCARTDAELSRLLPANAAVIAQAFPSMQLGARGVGIDEELRDTVDPHVQRQRIFAAVRELFVRLGRSGSMVVVIDDMQWSDIDSLVLLSALLRPPEAPKMLLIAIMRPEGALARMALEGAERLRLGPLSSAESHALLNRLLHPARDDATQDAQLDELAREAQGHPLFIREIVRQLASSTNRRGAPVRLDEALWSRVAALDPATRDVIELTSVAGGPLTQATLASALLFGVGQVPANDLLQDDERAGALFRDVSSTNDRIAELRHASLIRTTGSHPSDTVEPYHDRVREAVLTHLDPEKRRQHHLWLARALERNEQHDAEALATHFLEAGEHEQAYSYAVVAAQKAAGTLAFDHAARLFRLALDLAPNDAASRRQLSRQLGDALANAGRGPEAAQSYVAAAEGEETIDSLVLRRMAAEQLLRSGYIQRGVESISQVLNELGVVSRSNRLLALMSIGLLRAQIRWRGFDQRPRPPGEVPALRLARIDGTWAAAICLMMFDQLRSAELQCQNTLLSLRSGTPLQVLRAHTAEAIFLGMGGSGNHAQIARLLRSASELAERVHSPEARAWVALCTGVTAFLRGDWLAGEAQCSQAEAVFQTRAGALFELASARVFRVWSSVMRGEFRNVFRLVPEYVEEAEQRGDLYSATYHMTGIGNLAWLSRDDAADARRRLSLAEQRWPSKTFNVPLFLNLQAAVHIELYEGRGRAAHQRVLRDWAALRWGIGFRVQMTRFGARFARGLAALAAYDERAEHWLLRDAGGCARAISGERLSWGTCFSELLLSGVAARRGNDQQALAHLLMAEELASQSGLFLTGVAARYRRGELIGGDAGRLLVQESLTCFSEQEIRCPERMLAVLCPPARVR